MAYTRENIGEKTEKFTITFTIDQLAELKKLAKENERSVSFYIRKITDEFLNEIKNNNRDI